MAMSSPALVLGVDGGNTKTIAVVASADGRVLGVARGGSSDIYAAETPEVAIKEIVRLANEAIAAASVEAKSVAASAFSLAGADWPEDFELLEREIKGQLGLGHKPLIVNDSMGALRSGSPRWEGVSVACGTFNAVGARNRDGRIFHLGFWPDRRGGFDLGLDALKAVYRESFDLGPPTALSKILLKRFKVENARDLLHSFTRRAERRPIREAQNLAPLVLDAADAGDSVACAIAVESGTVLGEQARVSLARVGLALEGTLVVLTGGVLAHPSSVMADAIMARLPGAVPLRPKAPPIVGALLLAFDRMEIAQEAEAIARALSTTPEAQAP
jgi:N-acetylglucosamine kinase-like BadF-type ATPase